MFYSHFCVRLKCLYSIRYRDFRETIGSGRYKCHLLYEGNKCNSILSSTKRSVLVTSVKFFRNYAVKKCAYLFAHLLAKYKTSFVIIYNTKLAIIFVLIFKMNRISLVTSHFLSYNYEFRRCLTPVNCITL